jgi:hypothetical protein
MGETGTPQGRLATILRLRRQSFDGIGDFDTGSHTPAAGISDFRRGYFPKKQHLIDIHTLCCTTETLRLFTECSVGSS